MLLMLLYFLFRSVFTPVQGPAPEAGQQQANPATTWTAAWSHDDQFVAVGNSDGELAIYETINWKKIKSWKFAATTVSRVEWNPAYPVLAVASTSYAGTKGLVQLIDMSAGAAIHTLPDDLQGRGVTWSPDGEKVAWVGSRGKIGIYTRTGEHVKTLSFRNDGSLFEIDWHPTENLLLAVEEDIYLIDIDKDSLLATYDDGAKSKAILCCQWHPSGRFFVTGDYGHENETEPSFIKYWDRQGKLMKQIKESKFEYRNVRWTKNGRYLAATGNILVLMDERGEVIGRKKFDENNLWGLGWNSTGDRIITSDQVGNVRVIDLQGNVIKSFRQ
jgi:WD40 repeat protein